MKLKKIMAVGLIGLVAVGGLVGCTQTVPAADYQEALEAQAAAERDAAAASARAEQASKLKDDYLEQFTNMDSLLKSAQLKLTETDQKVIELTQELAKQAETEIAAQDSSSDEVVDELVLGEAVPSKTFDSSDLDFLSEGKAEVDDEEYDYEETVSISSLSIGVSSTYDHDFKETPYLLFLDEGSISYIVNMKDDLPMRVVTEDEPLVLPFMGKTLTIVDVQEGQITYKEAQEYGLREGESITYEGQLITLTGVFDGKVTVKIGDTTKTVGEGDIKDFGDLQVRVKEVLYKNYAGSNSMAEIEVGSDVLETVEDGDDYNKDIDQYLWEVVTEDGFLRSVGLSYNVKVDDLEEDDGKILAPGESYSFMDFFEISYALEKEYAYTSYDLSFADVTNDDLKAVLVKSDDEKGILVGNEKMDKAYLTEDGTVWYKEDGDWVASLEGLKLLNDDTSLAVTYDADADLLSVGEDLVFSTDLVSLGVADDAESSDAYVYGTQVGTVEESLLLEYGLVLEEPEANAEQDEVELLVPDEQVKAKLTFRKK